MLRFGFIVYGAQKNRECYIPMTFRKALLNHLRENAIEKGITIDYINAHVDHVHALINLGKQQNLSAVMHLLKGESAFWINNQNALSFYFSWQDDYFGVSVSPSHVDRVRQYIKNQDEHHRNMSWTDEIELFIKKYDFERIKD